MSKRILIVEDEKNLARFVSLELQHEGYDVVTADNGREGLEMALEKDFDLILLDLMLPEMDGFEVTRRLQQEKDTYIMMMTARDSIMEQFDSTLSSVIDSTLGLRCSLCSSTIRR